LLPLRRAFLITTHLHVHIVLSNCFIESHFLDTPNPFQVTLNKKDHLNVSGHIAFLGLDFLGLNAMQCEAI
jgi:hypothetical protein